MHTRANGYQVFDHVHAGKIDPDFTDLAQLFHDHRLTQVAAVQKEAAVDTVAGVDFRLLGP